MKIAELGADGTEQAYDAMRQLRPHLTSAGFVRLVNEVQRPQGYRLVASWDALSGRVVAAAGFRVQHMLAHGPVLQVDDLSTIPAARGQGHASRLLAWLEREARFLGCAQLHLTAGTHRYDAHRLYLRHGFAIRSFQLSRQL
ncbi:GNAT family N-acetyltransferase [Frankia sp. CNm7]|uniref:GNAT family N-acetyltransferase n=1 Tax=Frankia nepalensis TaxID=1836974 RepID=A0A937RTF6_9ACTN|nr:GNAT family N-acetyltransferase [Frankia nepalensis]MBL7496461.1 GNAT family N-acetyltransferase [Frankia nepalensis]MBL7510802.1 GNAT family N-acetyltransferase [Frankia nepalensis]MBL7521701.1 GNAT family N-acetyltransferase [Frankia nepalensis]MBL7631601.1 GNAT family N-acetyltransferase [Frankia nepalensis]